jgi:hypothetical protein
MAPGRLQGSTSGAQQREEVEPALGASGAEPGEMRIADLRTKAETRDSEAILRYRPCAEECR